MSEMSIEAQAKGLGIPMEVEITDDIRHDSCDAHMATLVSIEGTIAVYQGQCNVGHHYEMRREIKELQESLSLMGGQLGYGVDGAYPAGELNEY